MARDRENRDRDRDQPTHGEPPSSTRGRWSPPSAREMLRPGAPPEPPRGVRRRGGGLAGRLSALLTLLLVGIVGVGGAMMFVRSAMEEPGPLASDKVLVIPRGSGRADIAQLLQDEGVIASALLFEVGHILAGAQALRAGEYQFKAGMTLAAVRDVLIQGRAIQHSITIPEGLTSEQIVARLQENDVLVGAVRNMPREGTLLPETYRFERGTTREQLLLRMQAEQRRVLAEVWEKRAPDLPIRTPQELVTLASIVEKETGRSDERQRVAAVFVNRLQRGMRLESDPTIIYGLVGGRGSLGRPILASEIRQATAYNTYVIPGLPPGPIANPGRASLEAAAMPLKTRELFFVADGTGGHAFAETYEQHQRNVARWRAIERERSGVTAPAAPSPTTPTAAPTQQRRGALEDSPGSIKEAEAQILLAEQVMLSALFGPRVHALGAGTLAWTAPRPAQAHAPAAAAPAPPAPPRGLPPGPALAYALPQDALALPGPWAGTPEILPSQGDEPAADDVGPVPSFPVPSSRRQALQRQAREMIGGAAPAADRTAEEEPPARPARRALAFDASEGTSRDPLRNRSFDLTTPKLVPTLR